MIGLLLASPALHAQERRPTRGERLALEGRCEVAVPELEKELELAPAPESARVAWRLGQCALRGKEYARAAEILERAVAIDPTLAEAQLDLARARYHAGDLDGADSALRAGESLSEEALWQLYRGMVDLGRGDAQAAVVALQRAVDLDAAKFRTREDPESVEPAASYYLGVALRAAGDEERARDRLHGVADAWAGTDWANEANRALGRAGGRRAWLNLGVGLGYDSNVVLAGRDAPVANEISERDDMISALVARAGIDVWEYGATSVGLLANYRGRIHTDRDDLRQFDSHAPIGSLWIDHALRSDTHLRFRYDVGTMWVDTDPYRISNGGRLSLVHAWSQRSVSELYGRAFVDDYRNSFQDIPDGPGIPGALCPASLPPQYDFCGPRLLNEHRARDLDGYGSGGGISHSTSLPLSLPIPSPALNGGYLYGHFESDGREQTYDAHRVFVGLGFALPHSTGLDVEGSYVYRDFRYPTIFPERDDLIRATSATAPRQYFLSDASRHEQRYGFDARLAIPLVEPLSVSLIYGYRLNDSTSDVLDYDEHSVGFLLNAHFARAL